jgi:AcrR family transcriptional regulator
MTTSARRPLTQAERVAESAQRLMAAAIELIAEKGFQRTAASEIAERAGYSRTMVAARYGSKEALLEHLLETEYQSRMLPDLGEAKGLERLQHWISSIREQARAEPTLIRSFYTLVFEAAGPVPSLQPWMTDWLKRCTDEAAAALRAGLAEKTLRADIDPDAEAQQFVSSGVGLGFQFVLDNNFEKFDTGLVRWADRFERARTK